MLLVIPVAVAIVPGCLCSDCSNCDLSDPCCSAGGGNSVCTAVENTAVAGCYLSNPGDAHTVSVGCLIAGKACYVCDDGYYYDGKGGCVLGTCTDTDYKQPQFLIDANGYAPCCTGTVSGHLATRAGGSTTLAIPANGVYSYTDSCASTGLNGQLFEYYCANNSPDAVTDVKFYTYNCGATYLCSNSPDSFGISGGHCECPPHMVDTGDGNGCSTCAYGYANCNGQQDDGCEVNLNTDVNNCGSCGAKCTGVSLNGNAVCDQGHCCPPNGVTSTTQYQNQWYHWISGLPYNGKCAQCGDATHTCATATDYTTCDTSDAVRTCQCPLHAEWNGTHSPAGCFACNQNYGNCDSNWANGCETNTAANSANCGSCGTVCSSLAPPPANCTSSTTKTTYGMSGYCSGGICTLNKVNTVCSQRNAVCYDTATIIDYSSTSCTNNDCSSAYPQACPANPAEPICQPGVCTTNNGVASCAYSKAANGTACTGGTCQGGICTAADNCPVGGSSPNSYTNCTSTAPLHATIDNTYTCSSGRACYKCNAGYEWIADATGIKKCSPVSTVCTASGDFSAVCMPWDKGCVAFGAQYGSYGTACCSACGSKNYDYACVIDVVRY